MENPTEAALLSWEHPRPTVAGIGGPFVCFKPPYTITIHKVRGVHPRAAMAATGVDDAFALREARRSLLLELLPTTPHTPPPEDGYQWTGKLAAALLGDDCCGVLFLDDGLLRPPSAGLIQVLRSERPSGAAREG